jgi:hypothetical protein
MAVQLAALGVSLLAKLKNAEAISTFDPARITVAAELSMLERDIAWKPRSELIIVTDVAI